MEPIGTIIIDHEAYGERTPFESLEDAQTVIRSIGEEFANTTLSLASDGIDIRDQNNDSVGYVVDDEHSQRVQNCDARETQYLR